MVSQPVITLVDDDKDIVALLNDLLTDEGYSTLCCYSGNECYATVTTEQTALIVLDMQMEQRDTGLLILEWLRRDPATANIPVIMCSADGNFLKQIRNQLRALNCEYMEKPFDIDKLLLMIATLIKAIS